MLRILVAIWLVAITSHTAQVNQGTTIRSLHVTSDIKHRYATTMIITRMINPSDQPSEANFVVTLPDTAFISDFTMEDKGKVYKSHMKKRAKYDRAVQAGQSAGTVALDARDSSQFKITVNVEPHGKVNFNLTYEQQLTRNLGLYTHIVNLSPEQFVEDMSVKVRIEEPTNITFLEVSEMQAPGSAPQGITNRVALAKIKEISPKRKEVTWEPTVDQQRELGSQGFRGQFVIKYDVFRYKVPQQLLVDDTYFVNFFAPEELTLLKKHIVFVLDFSGSMDGRKMEQLKVAMNKIMSDLQPSDYFSIVFFSDKIMAWSRSDALLNSGSMDAQSCVVEANPQKVLQFQQFINSYTQGGSTNILGAIRVGLQLVDLGSRQWTSSDVPQPIIVFLTDGLPNEEESNTDVIARTVTILNIHKSPIYSLAFGNDANSTFLRRLSLLNYGFFRHIYDASDAAIQLSDFYRTISTPLLTNITFEYLPDQVYNETLTKKNFPVFSKGSELVVCGKLRKNRNKRANIGKITGYAGKRVHSFPLNITKKLKGSKRHRRSLSAEMGSTLSRFWAQLSIMQLLDEADTLEEGAEKDEILERASDLSVSYSFATPVTSIVAEKPNQEESVVDVFPIIAGDWSFTDGISIVDLPSVTVNYTTANITFLEEDEEDDSGASARVVYGILYVVMFHIIILFR